MIILTGAAGFIGFHTAQALLAAGHSVIGIDNLNSYYNPALKRARLEKLKSHKGFTFCEANIADAPAMEKIAAQYASATHIVHLAAQAGVRYSLENPYAYAESNLMGQLVMLEMARHLKNLKHFVYASSSSVYGNSAKAPFGLDERCDEPVSLYAATKRSGEMLAHSYASLYKFPATGLRFFTVYGPWGRPDMAYFSFTKNIFEGKPIKVFNNGDLRRDFTYIDDIVAGIVSALDKPSPNAVPHRVFNLGNHRPVQLLDFIATIERASNHKAIMEMSPMAAGDVYETCADITESQNTLGFEPKTTLDKGIPAFIEWYRDYYQ
ncbi:MAG: NAD-dependent epimerase/dehydratase family protein [Alphaproteobacteria bacterium]|nr:NAD-dependent epimerase/dehydratase family protein [Alphaproteobacteria bacterium]